MAYLHQCPRCAGGCNGIDWATLMAHYREAHPGIMEGRKAMTTTQG